MEKILRFTSREPISVAISVAGVSPASALLGSLNHFAAKSKSPNASTVPLIALARLRILSVSPCVSSRFGSAAGDARVRLSDRDEQSSAGVRHSYLAACFTTRPGSLS